MAENEDKKSLKVEGLGEKTVPDVAGMKKEGKIDVTSEPTVSEPAPVEKVDVTATPTVSEPAPVEKVDVTATPTTSAQAPQATFDPTAMPTSGGASGNGGSADWMKYLKIGGIVFGAIVVIIIIISLVGGKKIVCTHDSDSEGIKSKETETYKFDKDGKVKSVTTSGKVDYSKAEGDNKKSDSELEALCKSLTETYKGAKCKVSKGVVTYSYTAEGEDELKIYKDETYDKMKKEVEDKKGKMSDNTTCKVK